MQEPQDWSNVQSFWGMKHRAIEPSLPQEVQQSKECLVCERLLRLQGPTGPRCPQCRWALACKGGWRVDGRHPVEERRDPPLGRIDEVSDDEPPPKEADEETSGAQGDLQGEGSEESVEQPVNVAQEILDGMEPVEDHEDLVEAERGDEERVEEAAGEGEDQSMWSDNGRPCGNNIYEVIVIDSD